MSDYVVEAAGVEFAAVTEAGPGDFTVEAVAADGYTVEAVAEVYLVEADAEEFTVEPGPAEFDLLTDREQGPPGPPGLPGNVARVRERLAGATDGTNATFAASYDFAPESVSVYLNGQLLTLGADYQTSGTRTVLLFSSPGAGEVAFATYDRS